MSWHLRIYGKDDSLVIELPITADQADLLLGMMPHKMSSWPVPRLSGGEWDAFVDWDEPGRTTAGTVYPHLT